MWDRDVVTAGFVQAIGNEAKLELDRRLLSTETIREESQGGGAWSLNSPLAGDVGQ